MIQHIALARFQSGVTDDQIKHCFEEIGRLKQVIPGIVHYSWGANNSPEGLSQGFTHAFVMTFNDRAARDRYLAHPAHAAAKEIVLKIAAGAAVVDYEA